MKFKMMKKRIPSVFCSVLHQQQKSIATAPGVQQIKISIGSLHQPDMGNQQFNSLHPKSGNWFPLALNYFL